MKFTIDTLAQEMQEKADKLIKLESVWRKDKTKSTLAAYRTEELYYALICSPKNICAIIEDRAELIKTIHTLQNIKNN